MSGPEPEAGSRDLRIVRSLWRTHRKWLILWGEFQVVATFPLLAGLSGGTDPERVPSLLAFWLVVAVVSTLLFYPWLSHYRARQRLHTSAPLP